MQRRGGEREGENAVFTHFVALCLQHAMPHYPRRGKEAECQGRTSREGQLKLRPATFIRADRTSRQTEHRYIFASIPTKRMH